MTEQTKQKLKDALIEHKNIASSEYNDEDAFVGIYFCDLVDIIDGIMQNTGWHPASELPPEEGEYIVKREWAPARADLSYSKFENGKWSTPQVKWWCYPPKEK